MSSKSEYIYQPLMDQLGSMRPADFDDSVPAHTVGVEAIDATGPRINDRVQEARLALAELAIVMGYVSRERVEQGTTFQPNTPMAIPGIDNGILQQLDGLDRQSSLEVASPENEAYQNRASDVLEWFDAINDGTPLRLMQRDHSAENLPAGSREQTTVTHSLMRKVGEVYEIAESSWKVNEFRAIAKIHSSHNRIHFKRTAQGGVSQAIITTTNDYENLTSPLVVGESTALPTNTYNVVRRLEQFKKHYSVQQKIATTLSLLEALPPKPMKHGLLSYDRRRQVLSRRKVATDDQIFEVTSYGVRGKAITPTAISLADAKTNSYVFLDYDKQDIQVENSLRAKERISATEVIEQVNSALREEVLKHEQ